MHARPFQIFRYFLSPKHPIISEEAKVIWKPLQGTVPPFGSSLSVIPFSERCFWFNECFSVWEGTIMKMEYLASTAASELQSDWRKWNKLPQIAVYRAREEFPVPLLATIISEKSKHILCCSEPKHQRRPLNMLLGREREKKSETVTTTPVVNIVCFQKIFKKIRNLIQDQWLGLMPPLNVMKQIYKLEYYKNYPPCFSRAFCLK